MRQISMFQYVLVCFSMYVLYQIIIREYCFYYVCQSNDTYTHLVDVLSHLHINSYSYDDVINKLKVSSFEADLYSTVFMQITMGPKIDLSSSLVDKQIFFCLLICLLIMTTSSAGAEISDGPQKRGFRRTGPNDFMFVYNLVQRDLSI